MFLVLLCPDVSLSEWPKCPNNDLAHNWSLVDRVILLNRIVIYLIGITKKKGKMLYSLVIIIGFMDSILRTRFDLIKFIFHTQLLMITMLLRKMQLMK